VGWSESTKSSSPAEAAASRLDVSRCDSRRGRARTAGRLPFPPPRSRAVDLDHPGPVPCLLLLSIESNELRGLDFCGTPSSVDADCEASNPRTASFIAAVTETSRERGDAGSKRRLLDCGEAASFPTRRGNGEHCERHGTMRRPASGIRHRAALQTATLARRELLRYERRFQSPSSFRASAACAGSRLIERELRRRAAASACTARPTPSHVPHQVLVLGPLGRFLAISITLRDEVDPSTTTSCRQASCRLRFHVCVACPLGVVPGVRDLRGVRRVLAVDGRR